MADTNDPRWANSLAASYLERVQLNVADKEVQLERERAEKAEAELARLQGSRLWKALGPIRRDKKKQAEKESKHELLPGIKLHPSASPQRRRVGLASRLSSVAGQYGITVDPKDLTAGLAAVGQLLEQHKDDRQLVWVTYIAVVAQFPTESEMVRTFTDLAVNGAESTLEHLLLLNAQREGAWSLRASLRFVSKPIVDPTTTSRRQFHTGIQRVVRSVTPIWLREGDAELMVWAGKGMVFRPASPEERGRIVDFQPNIRTDQKADAYVPDEILVPWNTTVVVPEPPIEFDRALALAALGEWSGSKVATVLHDLLGVSSPEWFADESRIRTTNYTPVLRASSRMSAVSETSARHMRAFQAALVDPVLTVNGIQSHLLPVDAVELSEAEYAATKEQLGGIPGLPVILSVSSIDPRKNHMMLLRAAERLWQEGHGFQLLLVGWGAWHNEGFGLEVERLQAKGRPIRIIRRATEAELWTAYRLAKFSVFISLAEGYGLPAAESLAAGVPVVLSDRGAMAEVGANGGVQFVDPRDLDSVTDGMRELLTNPERFAQLVDEAKASPKRTWDDYARETWNWLVTYER